MNSFLYFVEGRSGVSVDELEGLGYGYLLPCSISVRGCDCGPDNKKGAVFAAHIGGSESYTKVGYYPAEQTWTNCGGKWVGVYNNAKPCPADLLRKEVIIGHKAELGDGNDWQIPLARTIFGTTKLPEKIGWGPDGEFVSEVLPEYKELCDRASEIWDCAIENGGMVTGTLEECSTLALLSLKVNYRIGMNEATALGLFNTRTIARVIDCLVDVPLWDKYVELEKKKGDSGN